MQQLISPLDITNGVEPSEASLLLSTVTVALASCGRLGPKLAASFSPNYMF